MNSFTNAVLTLMLGWLRTLLNAARDFISSDSSTAFFNFFRNNWRVLFLVLCIVGFALDQIVYLIRWRPHPLWLRRRVRRSPPRQEEYDLSEFDADTPAIAADDYAPVPEYPYPDAGPAPTLQYRMLQRQGAQVLDTQPVAPPYATPYFAPEAAQGEYFGEATPLRWDDESQGHTFAPAPDRPQQYAFGMPPSFGSAQSEPAYNYHQEAMSSFAPQQNLHDYSPADSYAPQSVCETAADATDAAQPEAQQHSPQFRPFSDRGEDGLSPSRVKGIGAVAKRARSLLNTDEEYESLTYKDIVPTVDVSKAFHSPVYPEKKPEGDA